MAKRIAAYTTLTPTATADTTNLVDSTYPMALQGGSSVQRWNIVEVYLGGQAGASTPTFMLLSFDSQVATGSLTSDTGLTDTANDGSAVVLATTVKIFNKAATSKPQRDVAKHLANLSFNAFGGIVRLNWPQDQQFSGVGNTASFGEMSLSAFTGGTAGLLGAHIIYEPF
jgi:hypothetical protein